MPTFGVKRLSVSLGAFLTAFLAVLAFAQDPLSLETEDLDRIIRLLFCNRGEVIYGSAPWARSLPLPEEARFLVSTIAPRGSRASSHALIELPSGASGNAYRTFLTSFIKDDYLLFTTLGPELNSRHQYVKPVANGQWEVYEGGRGVCCRALRYLDLRKPT